MFERYRARRITLAVAATVAIASASATVPAGAVPAGAVPAAEADAFAPDLLHGDNGLPASSQLPLGHGPIATPVGTDGDALDAHEGRHLARFGGEYYLYGVRFGCGTHIDISHDRPFCGFSSYVSGDLTHWRPQGGFPASRLKKACPGYCGSPTVIFSPPLHRYLMYFTGDSGTSHRWLAESGTPTGPWQDASGPPRTLSGDTCGGTAQSLSVLPSARGPIPVAAIDLYRSSPGDADPKLPPRAWHGDWNQALAGRVWAPLSFDRDGEITPLTCESATYIPLARASRTSRMPVQQPDCRVTATSVLRQSWTVPPGRATPAVRVPVFQRAYVIDPTLAPKDEPPTALNAPLSVELTGPDGTRRAAVRASEVSWAPASVTVRLPRPVRPGAGLTLRLRTKAAGGCYGVLVDAAETPMPDQADVSGDHYGAVENGRPEPAPGARMLLFRPTI